MCKITISLITINHIDDLRRLFPTLITALASCDAEVLLVDNGSQDGSVDYVRSVFPDVRVVHNPRRSGYGANHNLNLKRARGEYFVIMNTDLSVNKETFAVLRNFMDARLDVGISCPKVLNEDGTIQGLNKLYPTILDLFIRRFLPGFLRPLFSRRIAKYEMRDIGYENSCFVPSISGAFMFARTCALREIGGFDERYFLHFEDVDLCRRMQKRFKTVYCPDTVVVHYWRREAHTKFSHAIMFFKSAFRYFRTWGFVFM